jgi:hypothetical protein
MAGNSFTIPSEMGIEEYSTNSNLQTVTHTTILLSHGLLHWLESGNCYQIKNQAMLLIKKQKKCLEYLRY